jgi:hypothetical protein
VEGGGRGSGTGSIGVVEEERWEEWEVIEGVWLVEGR